MQRRAAATLGPGADRATSGERIRASPIPYPPETKTGGFAAYHRSMELDDRMHLRDLLLGQDIQEAVELLHAQAKDDPDAAALLDELQQALGQIAEAVDRHAPKGTPLEAVEYALSHASAFSLNSVAEYADASERDPDAATNEIRLALHSQVHAGRLSIAYVFDCPSCGNVIDERDDLPPAPYTVRCEHGNCKTDRTIDPAVAHAIFLNQNGDHDLESWV